MAHNRAAAVARAWFVQRRLAEISRPSEHVAVVFRHWQSRRLHLWQPDRRRQE